MVMRNVIERILMRLVWFVALLIFMIVGMFSIFSYRLDAKKVTTKLKVDKKQLAAEEKESEMTSGSFMVASQCAKCNNGYTLSQIEFYGYDKQLSSTKETFFIKNLTDREMTGINMYIEYLTLDGRQLDKRFVKLSCSIPPGETRKVDLKSWDSQKSFYYEKSAPPRKMATPYKVVFDPVSFYLRF